MSKATLQEIEDALNVKPDELLTERLVEHLTFYGMDKTESRGLVSQIWRFIKDLGLQFAMAIQKSLKGGQVDGSLLMKYVENRWLQFINMDFAASNSSIGLSLREVFGAPSTAPERLPFYANLDGDPVNIYHGVSDTSIADTASDDVNAVTDRITKALDRYNAEQGIDVEAIRMQPVVAEYKATREQLLKKYPGDTMLQENFRADPNDEPLFVRLSHLSEAISVLGHFGESKQRVLDRAIAAGERPKFSMRKVAESLSPEIEANTQLASINHEEQVYNSLHNNPEVRRFLPNGTTYEEFLKDFLQVGPLSIPSKKKAALVGQMDTSVNPITNQKFNYNKDATIASLPVSEKGSSPQQTAIRDSLIKLNRIENRISRRLEQSKERLAALKERAGNLSVPERAEIEKLNAQIPMFERVLNVKDVGVKDQVARLEDKIGKTYLWSAEPGAEYLVPQTPESDGVSIKQSTFKIPANLSFDTPSRNTFYSNLRKQVAWLANDTNRANGSLYHTIETQNRKLMELSAEPAYIAQTYRMRNTFFDSLRNMLRGMGTPIAKYLGGRFDKLDSFLLRWGNERTVSGAKWSSAYADFKRELGWKSSDAGFREKYWNRIMAFAEDTPDGTKDKAGAVIGALKTISGINLTESAQSKLRELLRITEGSSNAEQEMSASDVNLKVQDEKLGKGSQRDLVRQGWITGRKSMNENLERVALEMRPIWSSDSDPLFANIEQDYIKDPKGYRVNATRYFTPTVIDSFVKPFIYHNRLYFRAPEGEGAVVRLASLANVRAAFESSNGDMVQFAVQLNKLEGGSYGTEAKMVASTLGLFAKYYTKITNIANDRAKANTAGVETLPRQIMDARMASDLPPEFINYALYDTGSNRTLMFQLGLNAAFGRNGLSTGDFAKNLNHAIAEMKALHIQLSNLLINEGKTKDEAKAIMGEEKYLIAMQAPDHLRLLNNFTDKMAMITKASGSLMADIRIADELLGLNASMNLQSPRSALLNTLDVLASFYKTKLSTQSFSAIKNSIATTAKDFTGSLFEALNIHVYAQSETNVRMQQLGMHDSELYLNWRDKLADYGPSNALDEPSGVETMGSSLKRNTLLNVRRLRQISNVGVADLADMATLKKMGLSGGALNPGDKNFAPKLRLLGIFNTVGHALSNGAIDGQYKNFKDLISRGVAFMKTSANPDEVYNQLMDGKLSLTNEDLGYSRKWMVLNDKPAFDYMKTSIAEKMDEGSLERVVADAYLRTKADPEAKVITDKQFVRIAHLALTEMQLNSNFSSAPIDLKANGLWRLLSPYLTWPYLAMLRLPGIFKDSNNKWTMNAAIDGTAVSLIGIVPLTMAASMMFDWFDEEVIGKKSNLRPAHAEDIIPGYGVINAPMATLERLGRYGAGGLFTEAINSALNVDDARGGMTADNRILLFSQLKNFKDIVGNLWQMGPSNANYAGVMRPLAQFMGLGGILQYHQILSRNLGLSNDETSINSRINVANYLRAAGRDLDLEVRLARGPSSLPNEVTPYLQNMELAAYKDDINEFRVAFKRAVNAYHTIHPDEPDAGRQVIKSFQTRHPLKRVFNTMPTERNYRAILEDLNDTGRDAVRGGIQQFNKYLLLLGAKPVEAKDDSMSTVDDLRKRLGSNEAIREAQAIAAQAAYFSR